MDACPAPANPSRTPPLPRRGPGSSAPPPRFSRYRTEEPFGVELYPTDATHNTIKFTGQEEDACTGNLNLNYRFFQDAIGRFLKPDCYAGDPSQPQSWNRYSYVMGDPVNYLDPDGHYPTAIGGGFWGSTLGGLIAETSESAYKWAKDTGMSTTSAVVFSGVDQGMTYKQMEAQLGIYAVFGHTEAKNSNNELNIDLSMQWVEDATPHYVDVNPMAEAAAWVAGGSWAGTLFGQSALERYSDWYTNPRTPWYGKLFSALGGAAAGAWQPNNWYGTAGALAGGLAVAPWAATTGPIIGWQGGEMTLTSQAGDKFFRVAPLGNSGAPGQTNPWFRRITHFHRRPGIGKHRPWQGGW